MQTIRRFVRLLWWLRCCVSSTSSGEDFPALRSYCKHHEWHEICGFIVSTTNKQAFMSNDDAEQALGTIVSSDVLQRRGIPTVWKPILCSYSIWLSSRKKATQPGVCDYIFMDSLYYPHPRVTIFDNQHHGIQWLLGVIKEHSIQTKFKTEFGLFIHYQEAAAARTDIETSNGSVMIQTLWKAGIHHYGAQRVEMNTNILSKGQSGIIQIFGLFKTIRKEQRKYQSSPPSSAHIVLGIDLYEPRSGILYETMLDQLRSFHVDGIIIRTHLDVDFSKHKKCRMTGPSVFASSLNTWEVAIEDALSFVTKQRDVFNRSSLMISFSMMVWWYRRTSFFEDYHYGMKCFTPEPAEIFTACKSQHSYRTDHYSDPQHTLFNYNKFAGYALGYDDPKTLQWKICAATKQFTDLEIGMALFNMEGEDSEGRCSSKTFFPKAHGYWRADGVSSYFRKTVNQPNFIDENLECPT